MDAALTSLQSGLLPKWLLLISLVSIANSLQAYTTLAGTRAVYPGPKPWPPARSTSSASSKSNEASLIAANSPVTPLQARTFGTWTLLSSVIRLQAALAIHDAVAYRLALLTFIVAGAHFGVEWFGFGSTRWGRGLAGPVFVSTGSTVWMLSQWAFYVKG